MDATGGQEEASTGSAARKLVAVTGRRAGIAHLADAPRPGWELSRQWSVPSSHTCPIHRQLRSASVEATLTPRSSSMWLASRLRPVPSSACPQRMMF